jgi:SAM-dependent methyltransferase
MARRVRTTAGSAFGRALGYLDAATLATWSEASGIKLLLSRWYARLIGFPELIAHKRFGSIRDLLQRHGGDRVLDIGAGNGLYSIADGINRAGSTHLLLDVSVRHMRRATATGCSLGLPLWGIVCNAEALPLPSESVDSVLLIEALQFFDNEEAAVREIARVLRPGGVWICEQDNPPAGTVFVPPGEDRLRKRRVGYTEEALSGLAVREGLVLERSELMSGRIGRWWDHLDERIFRRSRSMHYVLFPVVRVLARLSTPTPVKGEPGTVLYLFRKPKAGAPAAAYAH